MLAAVVPLGLGAGGCTLAAGLGDPKVLELDSQDGGDDAAGDDAGDDGGPADGGPSVQAVTLAVGGTHACATVQGPNGDPNNGTVRCWGSNAAGELGTDPVATPYSSVPLAVIGVSAILPGFGDLALSADYSCATTSTGGYLMCWGAVPGELPGGVHREQDTPQYAPSYMDLRLAQLIDVTSASIGPAGGAVLASDSLVCWGSALFQLPDGGSGFDGGVAVGDTFSSAAVGRAHTCAIATRAGVTDVECWGDNTYGQIGIPPTEDPGPIPYPTPVGLSALGLTIVSVAAGADHTCAVMDDGSVYCWGRNDLGQLGDPTTLGDSSIPTKVALAGIVVEEVSLGDDHACAVSQGNNVRCWGDNSMGQLGTGPGGPAWSAAPVLVQRSTQGVPNQLPNIKHVAAGGQATCVIRLGDPQVWCWGANEYGQAGQAPPSASIAYATAVAW